MKRERLREKLGIVVAVIFLGVFAWFGVTRLQGLMMLGFVDSAIVRIRAVVAAEAHFANLHPDSGYTCLLSDLPRDEQITRLLKDGQDNGYEFGVVGCSHAMPSRPNSTFKLTARSLHRGLPAFCSDQSGIVKSDQSGSVEKCISDGVPLGT